MRFIKRIVWYRLMLGLPILVPTLWWIAAHVFFPNYVWGGRAPSRSVSDLILGSVGAIFTYLYTAAALGGIQYAFFAAGVLWWARRKTAAEFTRPIWKWPLLFVPICGVGTVVLELVFDTNGHPVSIGADLFLGLFAIPFGYFYVGLAMGLTCLLAKAGAFTE